MPPKEAPVEEPEEEEREIVMSLPKRMPSTGTQRVNPNTLALRKQVMQLPTTKNYKKIQIIADYEPPIQLQKTLSQPNIANPVFKYKKMLKSKSKSLLTDLTLFGTDGDDEANIRRALSHMDHASKWFDIYEPPINILDATGGAKKRPLPSWLSFKREEVPEPGSRRVFHKNTLLFRTEGAKNSSSSAVAEATKTPQSATTTPMNASASAPQLEKKVVVRNALESTYLKKINPLLVPQNPEDKEEFY